MADLTYPEALIVGAFQGVAELFPVSSLGHSVLVPALVGGRWARDLSVSAPESPYLAFIVGLHVATAVALMAFFWRDWVRIVGGFLTSVRYRRVGTPDERLAWLLILATIPVGLTGLLAEHVFRTTLGKPIPAAVFLTVNGGVLFAAERLRRSASGLAEVQAVAAYGDHAHGDPAHGGHAAHRGRAAARHAVAERGAPIAERGGEAGGGEAVRGEESDRRLSRLGFGQGILIGAAQILALLPGISRSGVAMAAGLMRGLSHEDAARFSFLLATPVILAAGLLKIPDLTGDLGAGIHGQVLLGSLASGVGAYLAVRYLTRYFETRTLTPFAIYCTVAGLASLAWLTLS